MVQVQAQNGHLGSGSSSLLILSLSIFSCAPVISFHSFLYIHSFVPFVCTVPVFMVAATYSYFLTIFSDKGTGSARVQRRPPTSTRGLLRLVSTSTLICQLHPPAHRLAAYTSLFQRARVPEDFLFHSQLVCVTAA